MRLFHNTLFSCLIFVLSSCSVNNDQLISSKAGPVLDCQIMTSPKYFKKVRKENLNVLDACFEQPIKELVLNDLILAKTQWLARRYDQISAISFLQEVIQSGYENPAYHYQLALYFHNLHQWDLSLEHIDAAKLEPEHKLRLIVEHKLGIKPPNSANKLLPYLLKNKPIATAHVSMANSHFILQMLSNGDGSTINGEPSLIASDDGQNLWLTWTDSGEAEAQFPDYFYWDIESLRSNDGGLTWTPFDMDTLPGQINRFHFDPMTAFDATNQSLYAGGMVKGFDSMIDDAIFVYRWDLSDDSTHGPFKLFQQSPDKGWLTTDSNGNLYLAHYTGIEKSTNKGQTFSTISSENGYGPQPRMNNNDCLIVTDIDHVISCNGNGLTKYPANFSSFILDATDVIPGSFRVPTLTLHAIAPNDDIFAIYTDRKTNNSSETTIYMTKSSDNGQNWSAPWKVAPDITGDQFLPWIEIDDFGGMHLAYMDTRNQIQSDNALKATLDLYYSYSNDGGQNWLETRVTPDSFTTPDLIWGDYFMSDYIAMSVTNDKVHLAFPWSEQSDEMHMYLASMHLNDLIFKNSFE